MLDGWPDDDDSEGQSLDDARAIVEIMRTPHLRSFGQVHIPGDFFWGPVRESPPVLLDGSHLESAFDCLSHNEDNSVDVFPSGLQFLDTLHELHLQLYFGSYYG